MFFEFQVKFGNKEREEESKKILETKHLEDLYAWSFEPPITVRPKHLQA